MIEILKSNARKIDINFTSIDETCVKLPNDRVCEPPKPYLCVLCMLYNTQGIAAPTCLLSGDVFYMKYTTVSSDMCLVVMPYATLDFQFIEQHSMARFTCLHS